MPKFKIADIVMNLQMPDSLIDDNFSDFRCEEDLSDDIKIDITSGPHPGYPENGKIINNVRVHMVFETDDGIHYYHTLEDVVSHVKADTNYNNGMINISPKYNNNRDSFEFVKTAVNNEIRRLFICKHALSKGLYMHSVAINYNGKGVLFSAPSGTGKSTHAHLWQEVFSGIEIINGDIGTLKIVGDDVFVYGAPWCGTSQEYINTRVPVQAIVFLEQADKNEIVELDDVEKFVRLSARCFLPTWNPKTLQASIDTAEYVAKNTKCYLLKCRPDHEAAILVEKTI